MVFWRKKIPVLLLMLAMTFMMMSCMAFAEQNEAVQDGEAATPLTLHLAYGIELQISGDSEESFSHAQKIHPTPVTEVFSLCIDAVEIPLCRVDFGNENIGERMGVLRLEEGDVPVTFTMYPLSEDEIAELDEEALASYHETMEDINSVLEAIRTDSRFLEAAEGAMLEKRDLMLKYWTIALPEEITCEETEENGVYCAVFYGRICGENIALYQVSIGDNTDELMGVYSIDGQELPLGVEVFEPGMNVFWSQADYERVYQMMDTVNDVMECIMADENFQG